MGKCLLCDKNHPIKYCTKFRWMLKEERREVLLRHKYCLNCLSDRHERKDCTSKNRCDICSGAHHTMIHRTLSDIASESFSMADVPESECEDSDLDELEGAVGGIDLDGPSETTAVESNLKQKAPEKSKLYSYTYDPLSLFHNYNAIVSCKIRVKSKLIEATFLLNEFVQKSHVVFDRVEMLPYRTKLKNGVNYGLFDLITRKGNVIPVWLIIVPNLKVTPPSRPSYNSKLYNILQDQGIMAHPDPLNCHRLDGIIGADICRYTLYGSKEDFSLWPRVKIQQSKFGLISYFPPPGAGVC